MRKFHAELNNTQVELYKRNLLNNTRLELPYPKTSLGTLSWYYYYFEDLVTVEEEMTLIEKVTAAQLASKYKKLLRTKPGATLIAGSVTKTAKELLKQTALNQR